MKKLLGLLTAAVLAVGTAAFAQESGKDDIKKAGKDVKKAGKDTGKGRQEHRQGRQEGNQEGREQIRESHRERREEGEEKDQSVFRELRRPLTGVLFVPARVNSNRRIHTRGRSAGANFQRRAACIARAEK